MLNSKVKNHIYIHMGYSRSASTWLQNKVFPVIPNLQYLGKTEADYPQWMINWNYLDRLMLDKNVDVIQSHLNRGLERGDVLVSSEAFTQTGGIVDQIERIKSLVTDPKIILVLRDPVDLVVSKYRQSRMQGFFNDKLEHYLDYSSAPFDLVRRKRLYLHDYIYPLVIEKLFCEFGSKNTLVIKYEYLVKDSKAFLAILLKFLGVKDKLEIDYLPVNQSDKNIFVEQETIKHLRCFFDSIFNYSVIPDYIVD